jgi:hypothetical protein
LEKAPARQSVLTHPKVLLADQDIVYDRGGDRVCGRRAHSSGCVQCRSEDRGQQFRFLRTRRCRFSSDGKRRHTCHTPRPKPRPIRPSTPRCRGRGRPTPSRFGWTLESPRLSNGSSTRGFARRFVLGRLPPGVRLPSSRALVRRLGISRNTVLFAYEELAADGWVSGKNRLRSPRRLEGTGCAVRRSGWADARWSWARSEFPLSLSERTEKERCRLALSPVCPDFARVSLLLLMVLGTAALHLISWPIPVPLDATPCF